MTVAAAAMLGACSVVPAVESYRVQDDRIPVPLTAVAGDPARGRDVLAGREGNCLLCHAVPESGARFMGNLGPSLSGVGARLDAGQLRLRVVDPSRPHPGTIMPSYYRVDGLTRVAPAYRGKPVLTAQQIEDLIAFLGTLK